jgi:hypothetical protein
MSHPSDVLYDLARLLQWPVEGLLLSGLFLLATIAAICGVGTVSGRATEARIEVS